MDPKEITYEMVQKKLQEIAMARGKTTRIDRQEQIEMLTYLAGVTKGPVQKSAMTVPNWNRCAQTMFNIMVWGNLGAFLERLDDEWNSSLKTLDPHANEYMSA
ncbi:hypothetical protein ABPG75_002665 [Micractinium tetrahymenae]